MGDILDTYDLGLSVFPVGADKRPLAPWESYQAARASRAQVQEWLSREETALSYGVVTGPISGIVVVDTDTPEAERVATELLPVTPLMVRTAKGMHRYYRHPVGSEIRNRARIYLSDGSQVAIDVRGSGGYVVGPGSLHPSGCHYEGVGSWTAETLAALPVYDPSWWGPHGGDRPPTAPPSRTGVRRFSGGDAPSDDPQGRYRRWLAAKPTPTPGSRNHETYSAACAGYDFGLAEQDVLDLVLEWSRTGSDPLGEREIAQCVRSASTSRQSPKYPKGTITSGGYRDELTARSPERTKTEEAAPEEWEEPTPLETYPVPACPRGLMPPTLEVYTDAVSGHNQTPRDNAQAISLGVLAAAAQDSYQVQIGSRTEVLSVAIGIGADSAERKSADLSHMRLPLDEWEAEAHEVYRQHASDQEAAVTLLDARRESLKRRAAKGETGLQGEMADVIAALRALHALSRRRVACQDVTPERLSGLLQEQGSMALLSAEGGPLEAMAGKYSGRRELANVYMQGYSGERLTYDRQSGASYVAERPSLTMVIMSQPVHLRGILTDPLYVGRGLLERFAWIFPPAMVGHRDVTTSRPIPRELSELYSRTIRRLLPSTAPAKGATPERTSLIVSGDAERQLIELSAWLEPQYRPDGALYEARAWANRLPTLALKVGTLWHLWDAASRNATPDRHVSAEWISRAVRWVREYILPMGLYARGLMGQHAETEAARQILALISSSPSSEWTAREISRRRRALTAERIAGGLSVLEEHGWIRTGRHTPSRGGRETVAVSLHPKIKVSPLGQSGYSGHSTSFGADEQPFVPFVPIVPGDELRKQPDETAGSIIAELTLSVEEDSLTPLDDLEDLPL